MLRVKLLLSIIDFFLELIAGRRLLKIECCSRGSTFLQNVLNQWFFNLLVYLIRLSWPYTKQYCCRQLLRETMLAVTRPSVYSRATIAGNTQLCNYLSYIRQLCCRQQLPVTKLLRVWPTLQIPGKNEKLSTLSYWRHCVLFQLERNSYFFLLFVELESL